MTAGYSKTPLAKKLGIKPSSVLGVVNDPGHFEALLEPMPERVAVRTGARGKPDVLVVFVKRRAELARRIDAFGRAIYPDRALWVCWPKRASGVSTDITEDVVRAEVLPLGLVDVKVCAVDSTWSGLKVVWRKERR